MTISFARNSLLFFFFSSCSGSDSNKRASSTPAASAPDRKRGRTSGLSGQARTSTSAVANASPSASPRGTTSRDTSREARGTRHSHPIPGDLKDLLSGPLVTSVSGGYNPETKRYFTTAAGKRPARSPSHLEEPEQETASPEPQEARGTRRSRPIDGDIRDLLASPRVAAVSGGFDPESKRYVSKKKAEREYRETEALKAE